MFTYLLKILSLMAFMGLVLVAPIKAAANHLETGRTGLVSCVMAVLLIFCLITGVKKTSYDEVSILLILIMTIPLVFMIVLEANYKKSFIISLLHIFSKAFVIVLIANMLPEFNI